MSRDVFRFGAFTLDLENRRLTEGGAAVALNSRYFDALALLVLEDGGLVSKDRFLADVWRGVPVTDEALTQCIRTLRRHLRDDATRPRFIETEPKHGYRFVAPIARVDDVERDRATATSSRTRWSEVARMGLAAALGGGLAGLIGGLIYGFVAATASRMDGGAASTVIVVVTVVTVVALIGGAGVGFGIAAAELAEKRPGLWSMLGGAAGGMLVGGVVKLIGVDAFTLLLGRSLDGVTGAPEGLVLGGGVGLGAGLARWTATAPRLRRGMALGALAGAGASASVPLMGGRLMAGSLELLTASFAGSRLRFDSIGRLVGEAGFGPISQLLTGALEGALFGGCMVGALILARRRFGAPPRR